MKKPKIRFKGYQEDWEQRKFGEIVQKYEDPVETPAEGYMRLGIRSHAKGTFHSYVEKGKELETAKMFRVAANNFIVNITFGWEHAVAITDESDAGKLVSHRFPQYSFKEGMNPRFFKYLILDECFRHHLELSSPGGAGRNRVLKLNEMLEYKMKFPQMEEQEEIAIYFEQLDNLITLHHRKYMKYADLSVFDWEQRKLGDVFEQTANFVNPNDDDIELWSLTVEDGLTPKSERYNREFLVKKKTNFKEVRPGDIVYNPMNMTLGAVGFNGMAKSVAVSGYYTTMVANKGYDSYYINTWLKSPQAISLYKTFATGSLKEKQRVQFPTLSIIPATFPEHDEQTKIGSYFEHLDHLITLHQRKCEETKTLKKYMLQKMFPQNGHSVPEIRFSGFTEDWEQRKLSELSEKTFGGGTPKTSNESFWKGNIPWIQSSDLIEGSLFDIEPRKYISQEAVDKSATKLVPENSVAIVTRVGVGKLAFMPFSYATSQDFLSLSVLKTEPQFTVYALYKKLQSELNAVQGTSIKGVTKNELLAKEIMIPCYEEQEKIGSYLHSLDHLITLHQRKCEETKTLKKYMLQKMFPQNGHSVPEIRFSGFTEDWEQRKFADVVDIGSGMDYKHLEEGNIPVYGTGGYLLSVNKALSDDKDAIGIGRKGTIDKPYILRAPFWTVDTLFYCIPKENYDLDFTSCIFQNVDWKKKDESTGVPSLSKVIINNVETATPTMDEQQKIGEYFSNLDHLITLHQHKCEELQNIKKFMLKNMFI